MANTSLFRHPNQLTIRAIIMPGPLDMASELTKSRAKEKKTLPWE